MFFFFILNFDHIFLNSQLDIAQIICMGLVALQHRGQESAGIVTSEGNCSKNFNVCKGMGMINNVFTDEAIQRLKGNLGIGHTRYSTSASSEAVNCQPFVVHTAHGAMAVAHNGELVNCESLRRNVWMILFHFMTENGLCINILFNLILINFRSWNVGSACLRTVIQS